MPPHIRQDVTEIDSADQLVRYAAAGQLQSVMDQGYTQERIALGAGLGAAPRSPGAVLATALRTGFSPKQLHGLDEIVGVLAPELDRAGRLSSLAVRLSADRRSGNADNHGARLKETALAASVPPSWTRRLLAGPAVSETEVLAQASGLLAEFSTVARLGQPGAASALRRRYSRDLERLTRRLALVSASRLRGVAQAQPVRG